MRKNQVNGKRLELFTKLSVKGFNLDLLINTLKRKSVSIYNAKKIRDNKLILCIKYSEREKFFAITKDLCYTITVIKNYGKHYPVFFLWKNIGVLIGAVFFIALSIISNDFIYAFSFSGSGSILSAETEAYLENKGVKRFSRFSKIDVKKLSGCILSDNPRLNFCECSREGNRLNVYLVLKEKETPIINGKVKEFISPVNGTILDIKVYKGSALVSIGDTVKKNQVIVSGISKVKDTEIETGVCCQVSLKVDFNFTYRSPYDNEDEKAIIFAEQALENKDILSEKVVKSVSKDEYVYKVNLTYRLVLYEG